MMDITVTRHAVDGFTLSTIHNGLYVHRRYIGYSLREAKAIFRQYVRELSEVSA